MRARSKIVIVPFGELDFFQINRLAGRVSEAFSSPVDIVQGSDPPVEAYHPGRLQYYSSVMLDKLERLRANDREKMLGVIDEDLYVPTKHYVYSDANEYSGCSLLSVYRIKQEFYGLPEDDKLVFERVAKEAITLIGFLYLGRYCRNPRCVMYRADDMSETDFKRDKFCDNCRRSMIRKPV